MSNATNTRSSVTVSKLREATDAVFQCVADYQACVSASERAAWAFRAKRVGSRLIGMHAPRATAKDLGRVDDALDQSATAIVKALGL